jgi:hypothetical protein
LCEILPMGIILVYVIPNLVWLPYDDPINWSSFSYVWYSEELETVLGRAKHELTAERIIKMCRRDRRLYNTHWRSKGMIRQILMLLNSGFAISDLWCARHFMLRDGHDSSKNKRGMSTWKATCSMARWSRRASCRCRLGPASGDRNPRQSVGTSMSRRSSWTGECLWAHQVAKIIDLEVVGIPILTA